MNRLEVKIRDVAKQHPDKLAIDGDEFKLDYRALLAEIDNLSSTMALEDSDLNCSGLSSSSLSKPHCHSFAILMDNHPAWAIVDLAIQFQEHCCVPLPKFFSIEQIKHALVDAGVKNIILDESESNDKVLAALSESILSKDHLCIAGKRVYWVRLNQQIDLDKKEQKTPLDPKALKGTKITYTSGTTDKPKGVVLSEQAILNKVMALSESIEMSENDVLLSILPLSTLLENIGGLYLPLYNGATATLFSPEQTGLSGSSGINPEKLLAAIQAVKPTAFIIIPQLLELLISAIEQGYKLPDSVRYIAMGGAPISKDLLEKAKLLTIPVYEGYGFSEAASVVAVNRPSANQLGSVGKVLEPHQIRVSEDGEILVKNSLFNGYLGQKSHDSHQFYATGDLGRLDDNGFLYVTGRKKNVINTSYGRNISPEWIEKELDAIPLIRQSLIYGHGKPFLVAIIVPATSDFAEHIEILHKLIQQLNSKLPDYARIKKMIIADEAFSLQNGQLTGTGRPKRSTIYQAYQLKLAHCYDHSGSEASSTNIMEYSCE